MLNWILQRDANVVTSCSSKKKIEFYEDLKIMIIMKLNFHMIYDGDVGVNGGIDQQGTTDPPPPPPPPSPAYSQLFVKKKI